MSRSVVLSGPCAEEIIAYDSQQIILASGASFVVYPDGKLSLDPERRKPERADLTQVTLPKLAGYQLLMADPVLYKRERTAYLGLFKGRSDYIVARFDVAKAQASQSIDVLIRSKMPLVSVDFFPAPDTLSGQIGLVQQVGRGQQRLYAYDWEHGRLAPLR